MNQKAKLDRHGLWQQQIERVFRETCAKHNCKPEDVRGRSRMRQHVRDRVKVAQELYARSYSSNQVGWVMHRDHTTIVHMVNPEYRERRQRISRERHYVSRATSYAQEQGIK